MLLLVISNGYMCRPTQSQPILAYLDYRIFDLPVSKNVCCLQNWIREEPRIQQGVVDF